MKIALVENFGADFYGARLRYALFLKSKGHEVVAIVPDDGYLDKIREAGIGVLPLNSDIRKRALKSVFSFARRLYTIFKRERFDVVHLYRMQPNFIGTVGAFVAFKKSKIINHITGLGVVFTKGTFKYKLLQGLIKVLYFINRAVFNARLIFQNSEDLSELGKTGNLIKGSAVNEDRFNLSCVPGQKLQEEMSSILNEQPGIKLIFVSRLLRQKGLSDLITSVIRYNETFTQQRIQLIVAGWVDPNNPDSYTEEEIAEFASGGNITFLGRRTDINELISLADVAVLPTYYREGTPRFLLEAMAMGKPIITTDMPGCNHLVKEGRNGFLVAPKDVAALVRVMTSLSAHDLVKMGRESHFIYQNEFSENVVYNQILNLYQDIIS